jgi:carbamoylphosphate synthase large subunit
MHKVALVDTNFSAAPIYNYLVRSGFEVFVIGGNPKDFLAKSVKNYINLDYSNIEKMRETIGKMNIDYIVPGCNDRSYQVCAELNSEESYHGLDTLESTEIINNKNKFRTFATQIGLPVPRVISINHIDCLRALIVKPVDAYSGRGMTVIQKPEQDILQQAIDRAKEFSPSKTCIIEENIQGQLYSHSAFITDGNIAVDFIVEEHGTANPFVVDTSRVIYDFPLDMLSRIRDAIAMLAKKLNLVDGLIHTQFIKNDKSFWLIEITRRCPGDLYSQLIEISTGFNYAETYARPFINQKLSFDKNIMKRAWVMRHTVSLSIEGVLGSIQFNSPVLIEKIVPISLAGDMITESPFGRIALLFLKSNSEEELLGLYRKTLDRSLYTINNTH